MDLGHLFKDTESPVLAWGTSGLWLTTADAITNTTAISDAPWDVTRHTYVRSGGSNALGFGDSLHVCLLCGIDHKT